MCLNFLVFVYCFTAEFLPWCSSCTHFSQVLVVLWCIVDSWFWNYWGTTALKPMIKRKKNNTRCKPLPPSKRLRLEAQRVLKERVQDIADKKGIKLRFCNLKECENHIQSLDSPCESIRMEIGWPHGVPFVHPHDLPNKAKLGFLEAYEPGWTASQQDMELSLIESGQASQHSANCNSLIHISFCKFALCGYF